jgi:hypothetical protein
MGLEREITFQLTLDRATTAARAILGHTALAMDGRVLRPRGAPQHRVRLYLYVRHSLMDTDRWVVSLTDAAVKRVRKRRLSATAKLEDAEPVDGQALSAGGEYTAAFVKLKLSRSFGTATGAKHTASLDWMVPVSPAWALDGGRSFWHLELEGPDAAVGAAGVALGPLTLGEHDLITSSKPDQALAALRTSDPYRLPPAAWPSVRATICEQLRTPSWLPADLRPLLDHTGLGPVAARCAAAGTSC